MSNTKYTSPGLGGARDLRNTEEKQRDNLQIGHDLWHVNVDNDCEFCQHEQEQQNDVPQSRHVKAS